MNTIEFHRRILILCLLSIIVCSCNGQRGYIDSELDTDPGNRHRLSDDSLIIIEQDSPMGRWPNPKRDGKKYFIDNKFRLSVYRKFKSWTTTTCTTFDHVIRFDRNQIIFMINGYYFKENESELIDLIGVDKQEIVDRLKSVGYYRKLIKERKIRISSFRRLHGFKYFPESNYMIFYLNVIPKNQVAFQKTLNSFEIID